MTEPRSQRARRMVAEVECMLQTKTPAQAASEFAEWQKEFPKLFEMIITRSYNQDILEMMIDQLERVERGSKSQHDASVAVGTVLVDRIVKPQLESKK